MEKIEPGKYIELRYDLYTIDKDGKETLVHQTTEDDPERLVFGVTRGVVAPLEKALEGLSVGDEFDVTASPDEAFGRFDKDNVVELEKEIFEIDGKFDADVIKPGASLPMMTADGFKINGVVVEVGPEMVKMDFNHPLVDKEVRFKGEVTLVRDATAEEIQPSCGCCGGGCHGEGEGHCGHHGEGDGEGCCGHHGEGEGHCHNHGEGHCQNHGEGNGGEGCCGSGRHCN